MLEREKKSITKRPPPFSATLLSFVPAMEEVQPRRKDKNTTQPSAPYLLLLHPSIGRGGGMLTAKRMKKSVGEREDSESDDVSDPLLVFGPDILMMILSHLDARSVARSLLVSRGWHEVASDDRLWSSRTLRRDQINKLHKCAELWSGKAHIPRFPMGRGISKLEAYSFSMMDGRRTRIMKEDLCDHVWEFRFKKSAPAYWRDLDPSWKGTGPPMRRYFHPDGSQTADPSDKVWGGHECTYSIVTSFVGEGRIREHYVRINRWPRMLVSRKEDWSWELANHLYRYNSIPDPAKEGGSGPFFPVW